MLIRGLTVKGIEVRSTSSAISSDEYFNLVSLLLPGTGTNGAQNNTFVDSSTNNFTVTRNGNTTQGTFSPFSQTGWSGYFDGNGDYLSAAGNTAFAMSTGDFTVEVWVYPVTISPYVPLVTQFPALTTGLGYYFFAINTSRYIELFYDGQTYAALTSATVTMNAWNHVAIVRSGSTITGYINGSVAGTITYSGVFGSSSTALEIGGSTRTGGNWWANAFISNVRLVKGTAVYTAAFTPSTTPLTAISGTSLLTCQSNRFVDNSVNAFAITVAGNTSVQAFAPFDPTTAYAAATVGGSAYFDGSGDYLGVSAQTALGMGSGDFTYEAWVYVNESVPTNAVRTLFDSRVSSATGCGIYTSADSGTTSKLVYATNSAIAASSTNTIPSFAWTYIAVTRSGTTVRGFINGALEFTYTDSRTFSTSAGTNIAADSSGGATFNGYISSARILKGTAVYTSAFTPPTAPLTAISNTSLLLNYTNGGITDATAKNVLETVGGAAISTAQSKFGGSSIYLDGTGDYLTFPSSQNFAMGTGDFTFEGWVYATGSDAGDATGIFQQGTSLFPTSASNSLAVAIRPVSATVRWHTYAKNTSQDSTATVSLNTWYHFAFVRNGTTTTLYIDGSSVITVTSDTTNYTGTFLGIGSIYGTVNTNWEGYIDDLRITKGVARYTSNFTPPTQAFPTQ
jgi:hypothetical protein